MNPPLAIGFGEELPEVHPLDKTESPEIYPLALGLGEASGEPAEIAKAWRLKLLISLLVAAAPRKERYHYRSWFPHRTRGIDLIYICRVAIRRFTRGVAM